MKHGKKIALMGLLAVVLFGSCKKDPLNNLTNEESRIYISNYDTAVNFASYKTFSIADSVSVIQNGQLYNKSLSAFDTTAINTVRSLMQQRGYVLTGNKSSPDLAVNISRVYNTATGIFSYADYWGYYGSYWDPYYWGFPGYGYYSPYAFGIYTITQGGLEIDLLDLKNAAANGKKLVSVWSGLARGENVFSPIVAAGEISALFAQSPYLKTN